MDFIKILNKQEIFFKFLNKLKNNLIYAKMVKVLRYIWSFVWENKVQLRIKCESKNSRIKFAWWVVYWFDSICFILVEVSCWIGTIGTNRDKHWSQCLVKLGWFNDGSCVHTNNSRLFCNIPLGDVVVKCWL